MFACLRFITIEREISYAELDPINSFYGSFYCFDPVTRSAQDGGITLALTFISLITRNLTATMGLRGEEVTTSSYESAGSGSNPGPNPGPRILQLANRPPFVRSINGCLRKPEEGKLW